MGEAASALLKDTGDTFGKKLLPFLADELAQLSG